MKNLMMMATVIFLILPVMTWAQEEKDAAEEPSLLERVQKAAELIKTSEDAREAGIPEEEVAEVLEEARERGLSPEETEAVLAESTEAVKESGPVDNFGAFVKSKLDEGLRGPELAAAIHEEHRLHGKGKGHGKDKGKKEKHKGHKHGQKGDRPEDDDDDDDDDGKGKGHGKGGKKEKGDK